MSHLLHLMFRCDGDVMGSDVFVGFLVDLNGAEQTKREAGKNRQMFAVLLLFHACFHRLGF